VSQARRCCEESAGACQKREWADLNLHRPFFIASGAWKRRARRAAQLSLSNEQLHTQNKHLFHCPPAPAALAACSLNSASIARCVRRSSLAMAGARSRARSACGFLGASAARTAYADERGCVMGSECRGGEHAKPRRLLVPPLGNRRAARLVSPANFRSLSSYLVRRPLRHDRPGRRLHHQFGSFGGFQDGDVSGRQVIAKLEDGGGGVGGRCGLCGGRRASAVAGCRFAHGGQTGATGGGVL
jgi:hypothetical protein